MKITRKVRMIMTWEPLRKYRIDDESYYNWKTMCVGMDSSDVRRLKELKSEYRKPNFQIEFWISLL